MTFYYYYKNNINELLSQYNNNIIFDINLNIIKRNLLIN